MLSSECLMHSCCPVRIDHINLSGVFRFKLHREYKIIINKRKNAKSLHQLYDLF